MAKEGAALPPLVVSAEHHFLRCGRFNLPLAHPLVMGVLNITPDSFSDGGSFLDPGKAETHARALVDQGADILDLGAESTRPGATPVPVEEEWRRLEPVLRALRDLPVPVSIDTFKPEIMARAIDAGASMINDITALGGPGALDLIARTDVAVCLMHMQGSPQTMQQSPYYDDVVGEVSEFLKGRAQVAENAGVSHERIVIDPGFGFGKRSRHNLSLLRELGTVTSIGYPVLVGLSRKSLLGKITGRPAPGRMAASLAAAILAVQRGAAIVRAHDVEQTRDALLMIKVLEDPENYLN